LGVHYGIDAWLRPSSVYKYTTVLYVDIWHLALHYENTLILRA